MKKVLLALFVVACGTSVSAQVNMSTATDKSSAVMPTDDKQDEQIKAALTENEDLQDATFDYLKSNKKTSDSMAAISKENKGDKSGMIKSILGDKKLSSMAVEYIKDNPELLKKAMSAVGM